MSNQFLLKGRWTRETKCRRRFIGVEVLNAWWFIIVFETFKLGGENSTYLLEGVSDTLHCFRVLLVAQLSQASQLLNLPVIVVDTGLRIGEFSQLAYEHHNTLPTWTLQPNPNPEHTVSTAVLHSASNTLKKLFYCFTCECTDHRNNH